jgi:hypothetical protein
MRSGAWSTAILALADGVYPEATPLVWIPNPGPQTEAYYSEADELFYGGAAGGGKSDLLLGLALTQHSRSVIFRREYPTLTDLMDRALDVVGNRGRMNRGSPGRLIMPDGRQVQFGSCPHEQNKVRWQGRPHDLKAFDEVTHFTRSIFIFLKTWARTSMPGQRVRVVATGNPPNNTEGAWVIQYWAPWLDKTHPRPALPGELRWFVTTKDGTEDVEVEGPDPVEMDGEIVHPRSRTFIPALLSDNPYLASDAEYLAVIQSTPEPMRSQMLYGRFDVGTGDDEWQVIPTEWLDLAELRHTHWLEAAGPMTALGVDVARGGGDRSTFAAKHHYWFAPLVEKPGRECSKGREVAGVAVRMTSPYPAVRIGIDVIGVGASPFDILNETGADVMGINFGAGTDETDRSGKYKLANVRAAAYWGFREALDPEYSQLAVPPDRELRAELLAPRWRIQSGRIYIESKDEIKSRLGRSPDKADAVVLAWYADRGGRVDLW